MHIPAKFCYVHKTKFTYTNKLFPHTPWTPSYKPNTKFSQCQYSQNPNQNSSNNITNHLHCQNFKSHQHSPNCTMKKNTLQECSKANISKHDQSYNAPNFKITKWQYLAMKLSIKHATKFFQAKKPKKNSPWCLHDNMKHGLRVLKKSIINIPIKCWMIFLTMKSKKRISLGGIRHFDAKKVGLENGFH